MFYFCGEYGFGKEKIDSKKFVRMFNVGIKNQEKKKIFIDNLFCGLVFGNGKSDSIVSPVLYETDDYVIIIEGCIYFSNYKIGVVDSIDEDIVEITPGKIFELYKLHDYNFLRYLKGEYAILFYDKRKKKIILSRDRVGVKPLFYYLKNNSIIYGTAIESILAHPEVKKDMNWEFVCSYFFLDGLNFGDSTEYKNIKNLLPGQALVAEEKKVEQKKIDMDNKIDFSGRSEKQLVDEYYSIIKRSIKRQTDQNKKIGVAFSGGLDSNFIMNLIKNSGKEIHTFTVEYQSGSENKKKDCMLAKKHANSYGSKHHAFKITPSNFLAEIDSDLKSFIRLVNLNNINLYFIYKKVKKYCDLVLSGDGVEEQLTFYSYHKIAYAADRITGLSPEFNEKRIIDNILESYKSLFVCRSWNWSKKVDQNFIKKELFSVDSYKKVKNINIFKIFNECFFAAPDTDIKLNKKLSSPSFLNKALWVDFKNNLVPKMFTMSNIMLQKYGVISGKPFTDEDFVNFSSYLPSELKVYQDKGKIVSKYLFKKVAEKVVSPDIVYQDFKAGSDIPFCEWLLEPVFERYVRKVLSIKKIKRDGILNYKYIKKILDDHYSNKELVKLKVYSGADFYIKRKDDHTHKILKLVTFQLWRDKNFK